jgi:hypothetical protein
MRIPVDWTTFAIAVAGVAGTLVAPIFGERVRRSGVRREHLLTRQLDIYAELLEAGARFADNATTWSVHPLADLSETDDSKLDILVDKLRVVASNQVYDAFGDLRGLVHEFNGLLDGARSHHAGMRQEQGSVSDAVVIRQRMALADLATKVVESFKRLEGAIRKEMRP